MTASHMTAVLASPDDVAVMWRPILDTEYARIEGLIEIASAKLRNACPFNIDTRMALWRADPAAATALNPVIVTSVVTTIVKRFLINEAGVATSTETVGPYSLSQTYVNRYDKTGSDVRGAIQVTPSDIDELRPATPTRIPGSIQLVPTQAMQPASAYLWPGHLDPVTGDPRFGYGDSRLPLTTSTVMPESTQNPRTVTADTLAYPNDEVLVDATSGPVTVSVATEPAGARVSVKKIDASANPVTVISLSGMPIDGQPQYVITVPLVSIDLISDGMNLWIH